MSTGVPSSGSGSLSPVDVTPKTAAEFFALAVRSRLLTPDRATELQAKQKRHGTAEDAGKYLITLGELTPFQVQKLQSGLWQGLVIGRFRILQPVGRGGMGIVYRASDDADPKRGDVALKILPPKKALAEPRTKARFLHEVKIGRDLPQDPHIARVYDTGVTDGIAFIAMEFVVGRTVRSAVQAGGALTVPTVARVFADVALGLAASHAAGVIHRDVKPSNVMILPNGSAKLLDFGFALTKGDALASDPSVVGGAGYTLGTFDFIPPEQVVNAAAVTPVSDQYSLGCSMYYALSGQPPFPGGTAKEKLRKHKTEDAAPLSLVRPDLPVEFTNIVERLMAKQPENRFADCKAVAAALKPWARIDAPPMDFAFDDAIDGDDDLAEFAPSRPNRVRSAYGDPNAKKVRIVIGLFVMIAVLVVIALLVR